MKYQDSYTYPEIGLSKVFVKHKKKIYTGEAHCHPDDDWSEITGCRYAEMRAKIYALKADWRQKKAACEECRKFVKAVTQYKKFDKEDPSARAMFRQLNRRIREVNKLADKINAMEFQLRASINSKETFHNKLEKIKKG